MDPRIKNFAAIFAMVSFILLCAMTCIFTAYLTFGNDLANYASTATAVTQETPAPQGTPTPRFPTVTPPSLPATDQGTPVPPSLRDQAREILGNEQTETVWAITWYQAADFDRGNGTTFRQDAEKFNWQTVSPDLWPEFPNVPNSLVPQFRVIEGQNGPEVPDGLEYANEESNFCQQNEGETCRIPVAAQHYFYYSGDYSWNNFVCVRNEGRGCMLIIINVGNVSSDFSGVFDQGFRLHGRYFNGQELDIAIWALVSHQTANMTNMNTTLNNTDFTNAGSNCSIPSGCDSVDVTVVFVSGNELLQSLTTIGYRD